MADTRIDFYILKYGEANAILPLLCKMIEKAHAQKESVYIRAEDKKQAALIDDLLWTFNDISFIPHALIQTPLEEAPPILIGEEPAPGDFQGILINLHADLPENPAQFKRIIEIVSQDPAQKNLRRSHYKAYQSQGFTITSHDITGG